MSVEDHTVSFSLEVNVTPALTDIRRVQTLLYRVLGLLRRMGMGEDVSAAIAKIQALIAWLNRLRLAIIALQAAQGPVGWGLAIVGAATVALDAGDFLMGLG